MSVEFAVLDAEAMLNAVPTLLVSTDNALILAKDLSVVRMPSVKRPTISHCVFAQPDLTEIHLDLDVSRRNVVPISNVTPTRFAQVELARTLAQLDWPSVEGMLSVAS